MKDKFKNADTLKRVLGLIKPYRVRLSLSFVLSFVIVALTLYLPVLTGKAIDHITGRGEVGFEKLIKIIIIFAAVSFIISISQWLMSCINNTIVYRIVRDIRIRVFEKLQILPVSYIDSTRHGDIISRCVNDVDQFSEGLLMGFAQLLTGVITIVFTLGFMFMLSPLIALIVILVTPLSMFIAAYIARNSYKYFREQSEARASLTGITDEMIGGISTVKAFSVEDMVEQKFKEADEKLRSSSVKAVFFSSITNPATRFVNSLVYAGVAVSGAMLAMGGIITVGNMTAVLSYAQQYTKPFNEISGVVTELQNALACAARVFALIDEREQEADSTGAAELHNIRGEVGLSDVSFSYDKKKRFIENLSLDVKPGQRIAIVGPTGCGKTTVINLLMRFYETDGGSISVDLKDIRDIKRKSLNNAYGMVLQETWLKAGTVAENISMGKPDASREEITAAAKEANADSFIRRLPNGYDSIISEGGENLSAGQRQLLCIARVMLMKPSILILDEATSSIDTRTEMKIRHAFDRLMEGRTSFIVAHRLSTIREADIILVMKDGRIIERGRHKELLKSGGFYAELYESQFA